MITKMAFKNLFSFQEQQYIEFNTKESVNIIYGKNSSGKSNFLLIIKTLLKESICNGLSKQSNWTSCKFSDSNSFEIQVEFNVNDKIYIYEFIYNTSNSKYEYESLEYNNGNVILKNFEGALTSDVLKQDTLDTIKNFNIIDNGFMKYTNEVNLENPIKFEISNIKNIFSTDNFYHIGLDLLANDIELLEDVKTEMKKIDIDIDDIIIRDDSAKIEKEIEKLQKFNPTKEVPDFIIKSIEQLRYSAYFIHKGIEFPTDIESDGTIQYFELILSTLAKQKQNGSCFLVVDELEMFLHESLYKKFISFFKNQINGQLIASTHNQVVLEEQLVSKKNIFFIDKVENISEIYRLTTFDIRSDNRHNWKKMYNDNRFSALPHIME